jgi:hypothetical protein
VQGNTRGQILILSPLVTFSPTSPLGQREFIFVQHYVRR